MSADRVSSGLMLTLTFGTGVLDAATYLGLHGVFTANMTGNVVFVGLGLAGGHGIPWVRAAIALGGFVLGAVVVGWVQRGRDPRPDADVVAAAVFGVGGTVVAAAAVVLGVVDLSSAGLDAVAAAMAFAMGSQAAAARRVGVADVSTVVVTSTLAGLAAEHPWTGDRSDHPAATRRLLAVATMVLGAVVGALLLRLDIVVPVALAAALLVAVAVATGARVYRVNRVGRDGRVSRSAGTPG